MVKKILILYMFTAIITIQGTQTDFFKDESIILQTIYNHPKKALSGGILLTIIGLSLGQNKDYKTTWTQEAIAYSLIASGAILTKTAYSIMHNKNTCH